MNQQHLFPFQNLDAYRVARELARRVHESKIRDRELRDQATRAAKSRFLWLCEGLPNEGSAMRQKYFNEARNSLAPYPYPALAPTSGLRVIEHPLVNVAVSSTQVIERIPNHVISADDVGEYRRAPRRHGARDQILERVVI